MKTKIIKSGLVILALCSSCSKLFDDPLIKSNPNAVTDAPVDVLIAGALLGIAKNMEDTDTRIAMIWSGQLTGLIAPSKSYAQYQVTAGTFDWSDYYTVAALARLVQDKSNGSQGARQKGIGQVIEALVLVKLVSLWGDIPFSQAFNPIKYPTPIFDKQLAVYDSILSNLDKAIQNLSTPTGTPTPRDFIYDGDAKKWKQAAYTLKARLYLHLEDYTNAIASANAGIALPQYDALIPHGSNLYYDQNLNYFFFAVHYPGETTFDLPAFLPPFMQGHANPKTDETALYNHYFQPGPITALDPNIKDGAFFGQTTFHPVLTYFENQLILAEASTRLGFLQDGVDALNSVRQVLKTGYINGMTIDPSYQALGIKYDDYVTGDFSPGGIANLLSSGRDQQSGLLYEIISQKYIVMLAQYEVFNDVRRLAKATPVVQLDIPAPTKGLPQRFIYPQNEINTNPNVPKGADGQVADQWQKLTIFQ